MVHQLADKKDAQTADLAFLEGPGEVGIASLERSERPSVVEHLDQQSSVFEPQRDLDAMARQLGAIVEYVNQLQQVNTDGVEPLYHALPMHNVFREDEPRPSLLVDEALANAPDRRGDFYGVPAVLE